MPTTLSDFFNSWPGVVTVLGGIFILATRRAWEKVVSKLSVYFKRKDLTITTTPQEEVQEDISESAEFEKLQSALSDLQVANDAEFSDFLQSLEYYLTEKRLNKIQVKQLLRTFFEIKEQYEFAYLNLFLVPNTKLALSLLLTLGTATKPLLLASLELPEEMKDKEVQKEIIFNVLLCHSLIEEEGSRCRVSEKGQRFLEFMED